MFNTILLILGIVLIIIFFKFFWLVSTKQSINMTKENHEEKMLMPAKVSAIHLVKTTIRKIKHNP